MTNTHPVMLSTEDLQTVVGGVLEGRAEYAAGYPACLEAANKIIGAGGAPDFRISKVRELCPLPANR